MTPFEKYPELNRYIDNINNNIDNNVYNIVELISNSSLNEFYKMFYASIIDRTINLNHSLLDSISNWNIVSSGAILRILLDNLIISVYVLKNNNKDDYLEMYLEKGRLYNENGALIRESEMKNFADNFIKGINQVYNDASSYIHFSNKHYLSSLINPNENIFKIGVGNKKWPKENIENLLKTVDIIVFNIFKTIKDDLVINNLN